MRPLGTEPVLDASQIRDVLAAVDGLDASGIEPAVEDGVVYLRGRVASTEDATIASLAVDHALASAVDIVDELVVEPGRDGDPGARAGSSEPAAAQSDRPWTPPDYPHQQAADAVPPPPQDRR